MISALILGAMAFFLGTVVRYRIRTGSIMTSPKPGMGSGKTTREKHPIFFWFWNVQLIGATSMLALAAIMAFMGSIGLTDVPTEIGTRNESK